MPTETVYGLAADACNDTAVGKIYAAKGRPVDHPLIVHIAHAGLADHFAQQIPEFARALMAAFWPGPLTLILPRRPGVAAAAAAGQATIGLRCPAHPVALALLNWGQSRIHSGQSNFDEKKSDSDPHCSAPPFLGLAAPSANLFGRVSPTTAQHVQQEFGDGLLILDGGGCQVGIESTIVDCTRGQPVLLRPGLITPLQLQAACGWRVLQNTELSALSASAPKASGTLESHYAPKARVRLMDACTLQHRIDRASTASRAPDAAASHGRLALWSRSRFEVDAQVLACPMPTDAALAAQQLFAQLRAFDTAGVAEIWVETPPDTPEWAGVRDRLQRAAHNA